jgi:PIN domain nuclease of toxin-antitoxin system
MKVLLDSCAFLWLTSAPQRLSDAARSALDDPENQLYLSHISFWEIAEKVRAGQLRLPTSPSQWIRDRMQLHGVEEVALSAEVIFLGAALEGESSDLFDRLLLGQALREGFTLITPRRTLLSPKAEILW